MSDRETPSTSWAVWAWQAYREGRLVEASALPAVTVGMEQLRAAFDAGCENGWDHARWESVYDPQPLGCEDAFNKFLAALNNTH